ncbi:hypothetical protein EVAR_100296_1 [Eumeta japonica]|uniref:Uncharacterized protein n=1 Tax=Eumeta variegata TaxID=151549 RepID=A0A4C2A510_EUMVA|nr:hypothetical protein EVAR_100296_1 [Eumeta japonica]
MEIDRADEGAKGIETSELSVNGRSATAKATTYTSVFCDSVVFHRPFCAAAKLASVRLYPVIQKRIKNRIKFGYLVKYIFLARCRVHRDQAFATSGVCPGHIAIPNFMSNALLPQWGENRKRIPTAMSGDVLGFGSKNQRNPFYASLVWGLQLSTQLRSSSDKRQSSGFSRRSRSLNGGFNAGPHYSDNLSTECSHIIGTCVLSNSKDDVVSSPATLETLKNY